MRLDHHQRNTGTTQLLSSRRQSRKKRTRRRCRIARKQARGPAWQRGACNAWEGHKHIASWLTMKGTHTPFAAEPFCCWTASCGRSSIQTKSPAFSGQRQRYRCLYPHHQQRWPLQQHPCLSTLQRVQPSERKSPAKFGGLSTDKGSTGDAREAARRACERQRPRLIRGWRDSYAC